jgi:hypothetical protein
MDKSEKKKPYSFKGNYKWDNMDMKEVGKRSFFDDFIAKSGQNQTPDIRDIQYSLNGSDYMDEKYRELYDIINIFKGRWPYLQGPAEGKSADIAITIDRILRIKWFRSIDRELRPNNDIKSPLEERETAIGCLDAADETYSAVTNKMYKYWNIAWIRIFGHSAVAVYDDIFGEKNTYVLDTWKTQTPEVYAWQEWPFNRLYKSLANIKRLQKMIPPEAVYWEKLKERKIRNQQ